MVSVLLTRPKNASHNLAAELERNGYESFVEPLLVIEPLPKSNPPITNCTAVMITSSNALDTEQNFAAFFDLPCFCVGQQSADKARSAGFLNVQSASGDGTELARLIEITLNDKVPGKKIRILHIAGKNIDSKAQDELTRCGHRVVTWPVYAARPVSKLTERTIHLLERQELDVILVFSVRTAETLKMLIMRNNLSSCCQGLAAIGLSKAVIDALKPLPWKELAVALSPTEDAMIDCLRQAFPLS